MKKINQYKLLAGICALALFTACDFEEINTNPFEMTNEMGIRDGVAIGGAVTAMQRAVVPVGTQADDTEAINQYQVAYNLSADSWCGFFGQNNNWYSGSNNTTYYLQEFVYRIAFLMEGNQTRIRENRINGSFRFGSDSEDFGMA